MFAAVNWSENSRGMRFTYRQFLELTGLTKKEAEVWVRDGVVRTTREPNGWWRVYRMESVFEGIIAKHLADFSSRELLAETMKALRHFLDGQRLTPEKIEKAPELKLMIVAHRMRRLKAGGGVRGVAPEVKFYWGRGGPDDPVFVVIDLVAVAHRIREGIPKMSHE
jgi:hypothetical protein